MRGGGVTSTVLSISVYITKNLSQFCCYHAVLQYSKAYSGLTVPVSEIMGVWGFGGLGDSGLPNQRCRRKIRTFVG